MVNIPQIEALKSTSAHLYESLKRLLTGINAIGTTNKLYKLNGTTLAWDDVSKPATSR